MPLLRCKIQVSIMDFAILEILCNSSSVKWVLTGLIASPHLYATIVINQTDRAVLCCLFFYLFVVSVYSILLQNVQECR